MNRHTLGRLALSLAMLSASLYVVLWAMSFMGHGTTYPTGEPVRRSFDPVLTAALSTGAGILAGILMPYLPGQANDTA